MGVELGRPDPAEERHHKLSVHGGLELPFLLSLLARRLPPLLMELDGRGGALRRWMREDDGVQRLVAGPTPHRRDADGRYRASFGARESRPQ